MNESTASSPARALIDSPPSPGCRACVVVPVRDEAATLTATLRALAGQVDAEGRPLDRSTLEVILLANNCRDDSASLARSFGAATPGFALHVVEFEFPGGSAHVGTARRLLMDEACRRLFEVGRPRGVIASTDGDTRVGPGWLAATLLEVANGADAVGGDIRTDREGRATLGRPAREAYLIDIAYRRLLDELEARLDPDPADPWPRHHHHTAASLAVTAAAYRMVGGLPPLPSSEDLAFVSALRRSDLAIRHSPRVRVVTSARRFGRAGGGMADTLRRWSVAGPSFRVEHPAESEAQIVRRRRLRGLWLASRSGDPRMGTEAALAAILEAAPTFGLALEAIGLGESWGDFAKEPGIDVFDAVAILRERLRSLRRPVPLRLPIPNLLEEVDPIGLLTPPAQVA